MKGLYIYIYIFFFLDFPPSLQKLCRLKKILNVFTAWTELDLYLQTASQTDLPCSLFLILVYIVHYTYYIQYTIYYRDSRLTCHVPCFLSWSILWTMLSLGEGRSFLGMNSINVCIQIIEELNTFLENHKKRRPKNIQDQLQDNSFSSHKCN